MTLGRREFIRYSRQIFLPQIGETGQARLAAARVVVVGLGGLGCPASLYLASAGVGKLTLIDDDKIELSNLQRQILYTEADIGAFKSEVAARELSLVNPHVSLIALVQRADIHALLDAASDASLILDCTDNLAARQEINQAAVRLGIPLISAAASGWEGHLLELRTDKQTGACMACLPNSVLPVREGDCATTGVVGPLLGVLGASQAMRALNLLLELNPSQTSRLDHFDAQNGDWTRFNLTLNPTCPVCAACAKELA